MFMCGGMSLESAVDLPESGQFADVEISCTSQHGVEQRRDMSVGQHKEILPLSFHMECRVMLHDPEIKRGQ